MANDTDDTQKTSDTLLSPSRRIFDSSGMLRKAPTKIPTTPLQTNPGSASTIENP